MSSKDAGPQSHQRTLRDVSSPAATLDPLDDKYDESHSQGEDENESTQSSAPLDHSSPLTDSDGDDGSGRKADGKVEAPAQTIPRTAPTGNLRQILDTLDLLRRGKHPVLKAGQLDFPLSTPEYRAIQNILFDQKHPSPIAGFHPDLTAKLRLWAQDHLRWEYNAEQAVFSIRMPSAVHQLVTQELGSLLLSRFRAALETSGKRGRVLSRPGVQYTLGYLCPTETQPGSQAGAVCTEAPAAPLQIVFGAGTRGERRVFACACRSRHNHRA